MSALGNSSPSKGNRTTSPWFVVAFCSLFILAGGWLCHLTVTDLFPKAQLLRERGVVTSATVIGTRWIHRPDNQAAGGVSQDLVTELEFFTAGGEPVRVTIGGEYSRGSTVVVRYDPQNPSGNYMVGDGSPETWGYIFGVMGVVFLLGGAAGIPLGVRSVRRRNKIITDGYHVVGTVLQVIPHGIGDDESFSVVARWRHPTTGMTHENRSKQSDKQWRSSSRGEQFKGGTVELTVHPADPSQVVFHLDSLTLPPSR
jgi:hypothetical protein